MFRTALIAATVAGGIGAPPAFAQDGDAEAGEALFNRHCRACHQIGEDARNSTGPVLTGVVGEEIASNPDFRYSPAFTEKKEEGFVWTEEHLGEYLANPRAYIPRNRMVFVGLRSDEDVANMVAYLNTFETETETESESETETETKTE